MFEALKNLFSPIGEAENDSRQFDITDKRLAEAALMFHVIVSDGQVHDLELEGMQQLLESQFGLSADEVTVLIDEAKQADLEAVDLYKFTSVLVRELEEVERTAIIERLWQIVFADGQVHEVEDNIVWRVAELLGVSSRERMLAKKAVRDSSEA